MSGLAIAKAINKFLGAVAGVRITRATPGDTELFRRMHETGVSTGGMGELREIVATKLQNRIAAAKQGLVQEIWSVPARINGDWYWLPADVMPYIDHCQTGKLTDADLIPAFEIESWNYFQIRDHLKPGWTVFDIGVSLGIFSILFSRGVGPAGKVFSFEPNPDVFFHLDAMLKANGAGNVEVVPVAIGDKPGTLDFLRITGQGQSREGSTLKVQETLVHEQPEGTEVIPVVVTTVDLFVEQRGTVPDMLKIDVEGADLEAILGAEKTIRQHHPVIQLELHAIAAAGEPRIVALLADCGYKITRYENQLLCV